VDKLEIVIAAGGMPFGPETLKVKSLGGSESAVINVAKALKSRGHIVTVFCQLPNPGSPDFVPSGTVDDDGVRWASLAEYAQFVTNTEVDLLVVSRQFELLQIQHQAKKAVLWMHDLATHSYTVPAIAGLSWNFDEIWCVSEYHKKQIAEVTGYPEKFIRATRNGITRVETMDMGVIENQLLYAARPERGLENLVRPGGIMSQLPDYKLLITMYDNYPPHMMGYYEQLWAWAKALPNCEVLGPKTQAELRQLMRNSYAYVYPTNFEEVSCIIARECVESGLPMITTAKAALPETLAGCGVLLPDKDVGGVSYNEAFVRAVRSLERDSLRARMSLRTDLYWDEVADQWALWATPEPVNLYSRVKSLIEDSDIVPAIALLDRHAGLRPRRDPRPAGDAVPVPVRPGDAVQLL
jgi:glycosyltransferase involved in cell wall biosynthesis